MVAPHRTACVLLQCSAADYVAALYSGSVPDGSIVGHVAYTHVPGPGAAQFFVARLTSSSKKLELKRLVGDGVAPNPPLGSKWIVAYSLYTPSAHPWAQRANPGPVHFHSVAMTDSELKKRSVISSGSSAEIILPAVAIVLILLAGAAVGTLLVYMSREY